MPEVIPHNKLPPSIQSAVSSGATRAVCPRCGGGSTREASLSIRRQETDTAVLKLSCWRSTCGFWAYVVDSGMQWRGSKMPEARVYDKPTEPLSGEPLRILMADYGLDKATIVRHGWRLNSEWNELVMPVLDMYGRRIGVTTRTLTSPKRVMTWKETSRPLLDMWPGDDDAPTVIVEDPLSAARLSGLGYPSIALLGTNMSAADAATIHEAVRHRSIDYAYLALDNDATDKSIRLARKHSHILTMRPFPLTLDIKNIESDDDIRNMFPRG